MLKLKDDVNLKDLEKYGFVEHKYGEHNFTILSPDISYEEYIKKSKEIREQNEKIEYYDFSQYGYTLMRVNADNKLLYIHTHDLFENEILSKLFDLIKDGLVEKE